MDFITDLPLSKDRHGIDRDAIMVIVDRLSKYSRYIPINIKMGGEEIARIFFEEVVSKFGTPAGIVSDRDTRFTAAF